VPEGECKSPEVMLPRGKRSVSVAKTQMS
jgi:hypothetical protein